MRTLEDFERMHKLGLPSAEDVFKMVYTINLISKALKNEDYNKAKDIAKQYYAGEDEFMREVE